MRKVEELTGRDLSRAHDRIEFWLALRARELVAMKIGVPTEIKSDEYRVAITPAGVRELAEHGHEVLVEAGAGEGSAIADADFEAQGARIVARRRRRSSPRRRWCSRSRSRSRRRSRCCARASCSSPTCTWRPTPELTRGLLRLGRDLHRLRDGRGRRTGRLPLLAPMSEIAGKIATQAGAFMLEKPLGGRGILLGGVPGVAAANVMVIGGGVVGMNAAFIAIGMEADVFVFDRSIDRLRELDVVFGGRCSTVYSTDAGGRGDAAARRPGDRRRARPRRPRARTWSRREQLALMKPGAVLVDVAIDQGGCFETSRPTTHRDPTFEVDGITHYCVANMPGAVPITSTYALTNATLPYVIALADHGVAEAIGRDPGLRPGVNVAAGKVTHPAVAEGVGDGVRAGRGGARTSNDLDNRSDGGETE